MIATGLLLLASWLPFHHHKKPVPEPPVTAEQQKAQDQLDTYLFDTLDAVEQTKESMPSIPDSYFDAIIADAKTLGNEKVTDESFDDDFDKLQQDVLSLDIEIAELNEWEIA